MTVASLSVQLHSQSQLGELANEDAVCLSFSASDDIMLEKGKIANVTCSSSCFTAALY